MDRSSFKSRSTAGSLLASTHAAGGTQPAATVAASVATAMAWTRGLEA